MNHDNCQVIIKTFAWTDRPRIRSCLCCQEHGTQLRRLNHQQVVELKAADVPERIIARNTKRTKSAKPVESRQDILLCTNHEAIKATRALLAAGTLSNKFASDLVTYWDTHKTISLQQRSNLNTILWQMKVPHGNKKIKNR